MGHAQVTEEVRGSSRVCTAFADLGIRSQVLLVALSMRVVRPCYGHVAVYFLITTVTITFIECRCLWTYQTTGTCIPGFGAGGVMLVVILPTGSYDRAILSDFIATVGKSFWD